PRPTGLGVHGPLDAAVGAHGPGAGGAGRRAPGRRRRTVDALGRRAARAPRPQPRRHLAARRDRHGPGRPGTGRGRAGGRRAAGHADRARGDLGAHRSAWRDPRRARRPVDRRGATCPAEVPHAGHPRVTARRDRHPGGHTTAADLRSAPVALGPRRRWLDQGGSGVIRRRLGTLKARISGDRSPAGDPPTPAPTAARPARAAEAADPGPAESWLLTDEPHRVRLRVEGGRRLLPAEDLAAFTPWHVEPRGLCSGDECVPWPGGSQDRDLSEVDLDELSELTGTPLASEPIGDGGFAIAMGRAARRWPLADRLDAPEVTLPDLDGRPRRLSEWSGRKRVLLVFASWCGCRDDLPAWQQVIDGLGGTGDWAFVAIAADESPEQVRPLVGPFREPVLHDPDRHFCEA